MKTKLLILFVLVGGAAVFGGIRQSRSGESIHYRLTAVDRGDVTSVVSSTGTLEAVTSVQVGTQVSGIIDEIYADFNDRVRAGQVIARIDTTLLSNAVAGAEAQLARTRAELRRALREYERYQGLHEAQLVSESEYSAVQYDLDAARASVQSAEVDLARASQNLRYATITSPIDGTVISRDMEVGQTVQASFTAPELFLIAGDLTRMQILTAVDESDIGQISEGQGAQFTVQAYPDDLFEGTVRQVRLQPETEENVVNYTAVIEVENPDGRLLPGMTATVDFIVDTAQDAMYVSNAALRYKPDDEVVQAAMEELRASRQARQDGAGSSPPAAGAGTADRGILWTVDADGNLGAVPVRTGITDGSNTVVTGPGLEEGLVVVTGESRTAVASTTGSPFQQSQQSGGSRPGPPSPGGF